MKRMKKVIASISAVCMLMPMSNVLAAESDDAVVEINAKAFSAEPQNQLEGRIANSSRGIYLQDGSVTIVETGKGKLAAGGSTVAQRVVDRVKLAVILEQYTDGMWSQVYSWNVSDTNAAYVHTSKTFTVPRGYYYRARGIHSANTDVSNSYTNGIWIG